MLYFIRYSVGLLLVRRSGMTIPITIACGACGFVFLCIFRWMLSLILALKSLLQAERDRSGDDT